MSKKSASHKCENCGWEASKWVGRCPKCQEWGTVVEQTPFTVSRNNTLTIARPITEVQITQATKKSMQISELDRVLGGGLLPGAVVLLAGEPGIGKSTLVLRAAQTWANTHGRVLYLSGEESPAQIFTRAQRISGLSKQLYLAANRELAEAVTQIAEIKPSLLVVDSIQTMSDSDSDGVPGGVTQLRNVTTALVKIAKSLNLPTILIGHVTKDGSIAGPKTIEHLVDTVLAFSGDYHTGFRMIRTIKNRFGPADEIGCFAMNEAGIDEILDPSELFTSGQEKHLMGTALSVTLEGRRPLLAEVQTLVSPTATGSPRRITEGLSNTRIAMLLAVLERHLGIKLHDKEVYSSTIGGVRLKDPAIDAAMAVALTSAASGKVLSDNPVILGEIALSGELRKVSQLQLRVQHAARLGITRAIIPANSGIKISGIELVEAKNIQQLLSHLGLIKPVRVAIPAS